ncbi:MAG: PEP-CTERM sorting domain-containing protein [Desulfobacteraceae bacterium]|nr:PEP-CTERM sorting domain-containing protein [Desulfobacteraceae bacterium]
MKKMKLISCFCLFAIFLTIGSAQAYLATELVRGTVAEVLDRTDPDNPISIPDPLVGQTIDLFEITYETEIIDQLPNFPDSILILSPEVIQNLWFQYGGGDASVANPSPHFGVYNFGLQYMAYQLVEFDVAMTIYKNYPQSSAMTFYGEDLVLSDDIYPRTTIKFSSIEVVGSPVPVPGSLSLLGLGLFVVTGFRRQNKR